MARDDEARNLLRRMARQPRVDDWEAAALAEAMRRGSWASDLVANGAVAGEGGPAQVVAARGQAARQRLIEGNQPLVASVAGEYRDRGLPFEKVIEAGNDGLVQAVDHFDWSRAPEFPTYAAAHIRAAIANAVAAGG
jgi:DNA-directed RNA polymerase sigma subunit (sigma70/sigma32)